MRKLLGQKTLLIVISVLLGSLSLVIILFFSNKYSLSLIDKETSNFKTIYYYHDLDGDNRSEKLHFIKDNIGQVSLLVYKNDKVIDHWNFEGEWGRFTKPLVGDFDNDSVDEVFLFSVKNDTLYMHGIDPINKLVEFQNKAITKVYKIRGIYDFSIHPGILYDNDYDEIKEIYFSISSGYSTRPRRVFSFNVKKDTVLNSPEGGAAIFYIHMANFEGDSIPTFFSSTKALGNCDSSRKYSDRFGWLMAFNPDLSFKFNPVQLTHYPSQTKVQLLNINNARKFLVFHFYNGTGRFSSFLALYNKNGSVYKKKNVTIEPGISAFELLNNSNENRFLYLITDNKKVFKIDTNLALKYHKRIPKIARPYFYNKIDIDQDGFEEFIFLGKFLNQLVVARSNFSNSVVIKLDKNILFPVFSLKKNKSDKAQLCIDTDQYFYTLNYKKSVVYKYWYIILLINSIIIYLGFYIVNKIREYKRLKYKATQEKIAKLQLQSFQNQIDPHFTFNIIETFGNLINEKNSEKAAFIFDNYTKILKSVIINSDKVFITLKEELDFIHKYLELEVYRNNGKFSYELKIQEGVNVNIFIPKMLIHIFVENAIKHGIKHLDKDGLIKIEAVRKNDYNIYIKDNGVGRKKAKEFAAYSTGKGLQIIEEILVLYNNLYKSNITFKVEDLYDTNSNSTGTLVKIIIPTKQL